MTAYPQSADIALASSVTPYRHAAAPRLSVKVIAAIAAAHVAALALLASLDVVPIPQAVSTLIVDLIPPRAPPQPEAVKPQPRPVEIKPQPRRQPTPTPLPMLAATSTAVASAAEVPAVADAPPVPPTAPAPVAVTQPRFDADYLSNPAPAYPPLSRRMGEEGKIILRVFVDPAGRPSQIELKTSSGSPRLDQAAQEAVWRWKFVPARRGDDAIAAWVLVPVVFTLKH